MSTQTTEKYALYQFTNKLIDSELSKTSQSSQCLGEFDDIEEAFIEARTGVCEDFRKTKLTLAYKPDNLKKITIRATEFGYDLLNNFTVLTRYWIHIKPIA